MITSAVTMPNMPLRDSACVRMWQWNAHAPSSVQSTITSWRSPGAIFSVSHIYGTGSAERNLLENPPTATPIPTVVAAEPTVAPTEAAPAETTTVQYTPQQVENGRSTFLTICAACHGQNAQGIQGLGKNLITSEFVTGLDDDGLVQFLVVGRLPGDLLNTTGLPMPPRGGNPAMTDAQLFEVVAYLRSARAEQDLGVVGGGVQPQPPRVETVVEEPFALPGPVAAAAVSAGREAVPYRAVYTAAESYALSCAGCHGLDGHGVAGFGTNLFESDLWGDGAALLAFLTNDAPPISPLEGYPHPTRGTYPVLTNQEVLELIGYLYSLDG